MFDDINEGTEVLLYTESQYVPCASYERVKVDWFSAAEIIVFSRALNIHVKFHRDTGVAVEGEWRGRLVWPEDRPDVGDTPKMVTRLTMD